MGTGPFHLVSPLFAPLKWTDGDGFVSSRLALICPLKALLRFLQLLQILQLLQTYSRGKMGRLMRITGPRGSGKTVLLTELGELVAQQGWNVVNVVSDEDVLDSIRRQLLRSLHVARAAVTANLPFVSAEVDVAELPADATFREVFEYEVPLHEVRERPYHHAR